VYRTHDSQPAIRQEHHRKKSFEEEYGTMIMESGLKIDERYFT